MKTYHQWEENLLYRPEIDGPPLNPHTISGAEVQIKQLASNIRTSFGLDPQWQDHKQRIIKAMNLLDQAAGLLDDGTMGGKMRNTPHQY